MPVPHAPSSRAARRLHDIPPTVFSEMSALAVRTGALNLGQGFPDVDGPPSVIEKAVERMVPRGPLGNWLSGGTASFRSRLTIRPC